MFVNGTEIYKFKANDSEIVATPLCLGNIWKDWSTDNIKKTGFNGYVYDFSVDYDSTDVDDVKDIHKCFMKKNNIVFMKLFIFVKKLFFLGLTILSGFTNASSLKCISMSHQECKTRLQVINVNNNNLIFYPFSVKPIKCSSNCCNINDPYEKNCVPDVVKN